MPVRYNSNLSGFSPQMLDNMDDNCACICEDACCHENVIENSGNGDTTLKSVIKSTASVNKQKVKKSMLFCPPPLIHSSQLGVTHSLLYSGSKFGGSQKSKGNSYEVEVIFQVNLFIFPIPPFQINIFILFFRFPRT